MTETNLTTEEIWKTIPDIEAYEASNLGHVRHKRRKQVLKGRIDRGYVQLCLWVNGKAISRSAHRLIMAAFYGPRPWNIQVNHINADKQDNRLCNLEYVTCKENYHHADRLGLLTLHGPRDNWPKGEQIGRSRLKTVDVIAIKQLLANGVSVPDIAKKFPVVGPSAIYCIKRGLTWRHVPDP